MATISVDELLDSLAPVLSTRVRLVRDQDKTLEPIDAAEMRGRLALANECADPAGASAVVVVCPTPVRL